MNATITEIKSGIYARGTIQLSNPENRTLPLDKILQKIRADIEWIPYGYTTFELHRESATIFISK